MIDTGLRHGDAQMAGTDGREAGTYVEDIEHLGVQAPVFSWFDFITGYLIIPVFIALYLGHKIRNKTRLVSLKDCDFEMPFRD